MDGRKAIGPHIPTSRLLAVMLREAHLTESESDHLAHCTACMDTMIDAARKELAIESDDEADCDRNKPLSGLCLRDAKKRQSEDCHREV
jgi:hypothetical protein